MIDLEFQKRVNGALATFFKHKEREGTHKKLQELISQIASITLRGGDRQRPYLCLLGYGAIKPARLDSLLPVLLSQELLHTYFLIHDDIMDRAQTRRGGPTITAHFTQNLRKPHQALSLAILAGDLAHHFANELWQSVPGSKQKGQAWTMFQRMHEEVIKGQTLDVWMSRARSVEPILEMYRLKTGNYGVEKPLLIGATLAGANASQLNALSRFGQAVGISFALQDDLLGVFGEETVVGKSTSSDITEGKWTPLVLFTYKALKGREKQKLHSILGNTRATSKEIQWVKEMMIKTGAKKRVEAMMQKLVEEGISALTDANLKQKSQLTDIARFMISRTH